MTKSRYILASLIAIGGLIITSCSLASDIHTSINNAFTGDNENNNQSQEEPIVDPNKMITANGVSFNAFQRITSTDKTLNDFFQNIGSIKESSVNSFLEKEREDYQKYRVNEIQDSENDNYIDQINPKAFDEYYEIEDCWLYFGDHPTETFNDKPLEKQDISKIVCGGSQYGWAYKNLKIDGNTITSTGDWVSFNEDYFNAIGTSKILEARKVTLGGAISVDNFALDAPEAYLENFYAEGHSTDYKSGNTCNFTNYRYYCFNDNTSFNMSNVYDPEATFVGEYQICQKSSFDHELYCGDYGNSETLPEDGEYTVYGKDFEKVPSVEEPFVDISFGAGGICALTDSGSLYCWGHQKIVDTTANDKTADLKTPIKVNDNSYRWLQMYDNNVCVVNFDNEASCWMYDSKTDKTTLEKIGIPNVKEIASNGDTICLVDGNDQILCKGSGANGVLGRDFFNSSSYFVKPFFKDIVGIDNIAMNKLSVCVTDFNSTVYCWGSHSYDWTKPDTLLVNSY